jgi:hypothetical protein
MNTFTYYFEDLNLLAGKAVYANGEADVSYKIRPAQPDVGIFEPYIDDIDVTAIVIYSSETDSSNLNLDQAHWLYRRVEDALLNSDALVEACEEDAAP